MWGGYAARLFLLFSFSCSADHERDWPPCNVVFSGWQSKRYAECEKQQQQQRGRRLPRGATAKPVSRETEFSGANGDREIFSFLCSADHDQDWQPYPVDPYSAICVITIPGILYWCILYKGRNVYRRYYFTVSRESREKKVY